VRLCNSQNSRGWIQPVFLGLTRYISLLCLGKGRGSNAVLSLNLFVNSNDTTKPRWPFGFKNMTTPLREKIKADLIAVGNEVSNLWLHHDIFWKIADAFNNNAKLQETGGHLINWLKNSYIEAGSVGLRRQLDKDARSVSLMNVLLEVEKNHVTFTKEDFQGMHTFRPESHFHNPEKWKSAGEVFDNMFGKGGANLDPAIVRQDIDFLIKTSASIKEQVDKEIAHKDRQGMKGSKATGIIF